ncbi:leucine-rich repeat protein [Cyanobium sp. Maggiore-St4-Cus]|uniref:leucine-rich repeat protein n=1 Tax=Cyanobium sp. Maggiore-St4-Cus TaxID=2823717 RepID=UPI0020CFCFCB|nr:leucine-rich repeat protein [Cyanobium sp. Maggiore-St4-Cus]MCP9788457.1 leucine-rich repeat protein [Cyanobium sp. Maggiore-St4-Cus]
MLSSINLGAAADTATLTDGAGTTAALSLNGGAGFDRLNGNASANNLTLTGLDQGSLDLVSFSSIENIYLEGGNDTVTIQAGGRLSGILDGGAGSNSLVVDGSYTISIGDGGTIVIDNGSGGGGSFSGFQNIGGGSGNSGGGGVGGGGSSTPQNNSLTLNTNSNVVSITGPNSGTADGTAFTNISDINLAAGDDNAILAAVGSLTGTLSGGTGTDDLTLSSAINTVVLSQSGAGTATSSGNAVSTAFNGFEVIRLDAGNDTADLDLNGTTALTLKRQLRLEGGLGTDQLTLRLNAQERQNLIATNQLAALQSYISNPSGQTLTISLFEVDLAVVGFETALLVSANSAPTDITTSASNFDENIALNTPVATFSTTDPDSGDTFTYSLVSGTGSTGNSDFTISGDQLLISTSPNLEVKASYSIRVRTTDSAGLYTEKVLILGVNDIKEAIRGNSLYTVVDGPTWTGAELTAVALGGHLATISSSGENNFLISNFSNKTGEYQGLWIGLTDRSLEGDFKWISGETSAYRNFFPSEPNGGIGENYVHMWSSNPWGYSVGSWNDIGDYPDGGNPDPSGKAKYFNGIIEIPLSLSITRQGEVKEGSGLFTTSINITAGTLASGNLAEGAQVWWKVTGTTADDLVSGALSGNGIIANGKLDIQHSLKVDADSGESFEVSVFSDASMTSEYQIGITKSKPIQESIVKFTVADAQALMALQGATILIPEGYTHIDDNAFNGAPVTSITLPSTLLTIGNGAFYSTQLTGVIIPEGVATIGIDAFGVTNISSVTIPSSITAIGTRAFDAKISRISLSGARNNSLSIENSSHAIIDGGSFSNSAGNIEVIDLGSGADTATIADTVIADVQMTIAGGDGTDTLNGNARDNILVLTGINQGTLDGITFSGFENVNLGTGNDTVYIRPGGQLTGLLNGGGSVSKVVYLPPGGNPPTQGGGGGTPTLPPITPPSDPPIVLPPSQPPGAIVDGGYNRFILNDNANSVILTGIGSGVVDGTNFVNFYSIDLKGGIDTATIASGGALPGLLDGGAGTDTLNLNSGANSLSIDQTLNGTAAGTSISGFESINLLDGNDTAVFSINSSATAPASRQYLTLDGGLGTDQLTLKLTKAELDFLHSAQTLSALTTYLSNPTNQSITLALSTLDLTLTGFESSNLFLPDGELPDLNPATLSLQFLDPAFSATLPTASTGSIAINNAADFNGTIPITYGPASTSGLYGTLAVSSAGLTTYTGNGTAIKNQSTSTLTETFQVSATDGNTTKTADYTFSIANPTAENTLLITATSSGSIDGISFGSAATSGPYAGTLLSSINLGSAADTATLTDAAGTTAALTLNGGAGFDRLNGNASANNLTLTGLDEGTLDLVSFSSIENIYLEGGNDTVTIQAGGRLNGILDGGGGSNSLIVDGSYTISIGDGGTIVIDNGSGGGGSFSGFQNIGGGGGGGNSGGGGGNSGGGGGLQTNSLTLNTNSNVVSITGPNSGTADGTAFTNISDINLAAGDDNAILAAVGSLTGTLSGGTGTDDLTLSSAINTVVLSQSGAGTATSSGNAVSTAFNGFEVIRLDAGTDIADLDLNGTTALTLKRQLRLDGGLGSDHLTLRLNAQERQNLISTGQLAALQTYISSPTGQTLTINLLEVDLVLTGFETAVLITANQAPTDLTLTSSGINENSAAGTVIGTLAATDPDAGSTFTYALVAGNGTNDADNNLVVIEGNQVKVKSGASINFETNPVLTLYIRVTDNGNPGLPFDKAVTASVIDINESPTDLVFTSSGVQENSPATTVIGTLSATDPDAGSSFTYILVAGDGTNDVDNALVDIVGNEVRLNSGASINFETNPVLNLNIRVTDNGTPGLTFDKAVTASVIDINESPTDLVFTSSGVQENSSAATVIGTLSATDPDAGSSFNYALVAGNGTNDADNALVVIEGNQVKVKNGAAIDFETNPVLNLNIRVTDNGTPGLTFDKAVTASVIDVLEVPADITPPTISSISTQGTTVILKFSETITAQSVPTTAFAVATLNTSNQITARTISTVALDQNDPTKIILTLSGTAPASNVNLRVSYTDPTGNQTSGVVQDLSGNDLASFSNRFADTFITASTTTLASQYQNLIITGTSNVNGTGNALNNSITGNSGNNTLSGLTGADNMAGGLGNDTYILDNTGDVVTEDINAGTDSVHSSVTYALGANLENLTLTGSAAINGTGNSLNNSLTGNSAANILSGGDGSDTLIGGAGADTLTGSTGADTFRFALADSRFAAFDRITDFTIGTDILDGPTAVTAANLRELGSVSALTATAIASVLTAANFARNGAGSFSFGAGQTARTFLALNDGTAGFSSTSDSLIEITGFSGALTNLAIV